MNGIRVTVRGADVPPGAGVTDENGYPLVSDPADLAANAWTLWQAARNRVNAENSPPKSAGGTLGFALFCKLDQTEHLIWPVMTTSEGDPAYAWSKYCRDELRQYLHNSGNMKLIEGTAQGRAGATWWVRAQWNGETPAMPAPAAKFVPPAPQKEIRLTLPAEPQAAEAPELAGDGSLLADILQCLNGDDRMHATDLLILLSAGNAKSYAGLTLTALGKHLKELGVEFDRVTIDYKTMAGVRRDDVQLALDRVSDAEAASIVAEAHAAAEVAAVVPVVDRAESIVMTLHRLDADFAAILGEYQNMREQVETLTAENAKLTKQGGRMAPDAFNAAVDIAVAKIMAVKDKEIESLTFQLRAAPKDSMTVLTDDLLSGVTATESTDYERRQASRESDSVAERLAGMAARRSGAHNCPRHSGGTYLACLDRNHRRDPHAAGYLLSMILADPGATGLATEGDYKGEVGWHSMTRGEAKNMKR